MNPDELSSARNALLEVAESLRQRVAGIKVVVDIYIFLNMNSTSAVVV